MGYFFPKRLHVYNSYSGSSDFAPFYILLLMSTLLNVDSYAQLLHNLLPSSSAQFICYVKGLICTDLHCLLLAYSV